MVIYGRQNATRYRVNGGLFDRLLLLLSADPSASELADRARHWVAATDTDGRTLHWHRVGLLVSPLYTGNLRMSEYQM